MTADRIPDALEMECIEGSEVESELQADVERLQRWKDEAISVLADWDGVHEALGSPARLGESLADASRREALRLRDGSRLKVAICEALLAINAEEPSSPLIHHTAIDWIGDKLVNAVLDSNEVGSHE